MADKKLLIKFALFVIMLGIFVMIAWSYLVINDRVTEFIKMNTESVGKIEELRYFEESTDYTPEVQQYKVTIISKSISGDVGPFNAINNTQNENTTFSFKRENYDIYDGFKFSHFIIDTNSTAQIVSDIELKLVSDITVTAFYRKNK